MDSNSWVTLFTNERKVRRYSFHDTHKEAKHKIGDRSAVSAACNVRYILRILVKTRSLQIGTNKGDKRDDDLPIYD